MELPVPDDVLTPQLHALLERRFNGSADTAKNALRGIIIAQRNRQRLIQERQLVQATASYEFIREIAVGISVDLVTARGGLMLDESDLAALQAGGFLDYSPEQVLAACGCQDIDSFQALVEKSHEEQSVREKADRQAILEQIELEITAGQIPKELFRPFKIEDGKQVSIEELSETERIQRYVKYKISERLTPGLDDPKRNNHLKNSAKRRVDMVLGFRENGSRLSSFNSEIHKSNADLSPADATEQIALIAEQMHWYDYVYPEKRQQYMQQLVWATD